MNTLSVIIPVYKQTELFLKNLKTNLPYLKGAQVIVVNDDPSVSIKKELSEFSEVILIENAENKGFSGAVNTGLDSVTTPYVMLLNSDVVLFDTSYMNALAHFKDDPLLFGVAFAQKEQNGSIVGKNNVFWKNGLVQHEADHTLTLGQTGWAEGGSSLFDTKKMKELDGFDELYSPFYWEDVDLSYRAKKQGLHVIFDPTIVVEHHHESTIATYFKKRKVEQIAFRNQLLFIEKNITDQALRNEFHQKVASLFLVYLRDHKWYLIKAIMEATKKKSTISRSIINTSQTQPISDTIILQNHA